MNPIFDESKWILTVHSQSITVNNMQSSQTIIFEKDIADGMWHFIVISWNLTGHTKISIDAINSADEMTLSADGLPLL